MNFNKFFILVFLILTAFWTKSAFAVDRYEEQSNWTITPRVWVTTLNEAYNTVSDTTITITEEAQLTSYGFSLRYNPSSMENSDFYFTFLTSNTATPEVVFNCLTCFRYATRVQRNDIELLYRQRITNSIINLQAGLRYITFKTDETGIPPTTSASRKNNLDTKLLLAEIGLGMHSSIFSDSDKHFVFSNFIFGLGKFDEKLTGSETDTIVESLQSYDLSFGYQYVLGNDMSASFRYRFFVTHVDRALNTINGPELTYSYSF